MCWNYQYVLSWPACNQLTVYHGPGHHVQLHLADLGARQVHLVGRDNAKVSVLQCPRSQHHTETGTLHGFNNSVCRWRKLFHVFGALTL